MLVALTLAAGVAQASLPSTARNPDEIIVVGERVSRARHETASSVAVETGESIGALPAPDRIEQVLQGVPNVQLGSGGEGPTIRGQDSTGVVRDLPAFLSGTRPRTTITIDGRSASYYELAFGLTSLFDVRRVEVFRSPQTTTQGRNSIGGAIFVETGEPTFAWEGKTRVIVGNLGNRQLSGMLSGPLAADQLAVRASADLKRGRSSSVLTSASVGIDPNRDDFEVLRFKLLAEPSALPDTRLALTYAHGRSQMPQIEGVRLPYEARRDPNATYGIFAITTDSVTGQLFYTPGRFEARTTVSYGKSDVRRYAPPQFGEAWIESADASIEPVLTWRSTGGTVLTGGLNYTRSTLDQFIDLGAQLQIAGTGAFRDVQNSFGVFGEATVPLGSGLSATAGLRYQRDRQRRTGALSGAAINLPVNFDRTFAAWLPKLSVAWDLTPDVRIGVLAQKASNPGGINLNTALARIELFRDERLWDFELFARARLADGALVLAANLFHYAMMDAQRTQSVAVLLANGLVGTSAQVDNAPRAWTRGFELELDWRASPRLHLRASVGLLDTRITETLLSSDPMFGKQFQRSPRFSGSASVEWKPAPPFSLSAQVRHHGSYFSDDLESPDRRIGAATNVDAQVKWTASRLSVFGYVRNLFDAFQLTYVFAPATALATASEPREFGIGIEARY